MKYTIQQLEACARLKFEQQNFLKVLKDRLEKYRSDAVTQRDEISMRWAQGRSQELTDLVDLIENADDYLRKAGK